MGVTACAPVLYTPREGRAGLPVPHRALSGLVTRHSSTGECHMLKTLFLNPPSVDGFDGGAGARYQARREVKSYWYPTWLAQPAALVPGSKLLDAPPHGVGYEDALATAARYDLVIIH